MLTNEPHNRLLDAGHEVGIFNRLIMEGHDVAATPQEQPETSGTGAGAGWGTCEELLLVSAIKRHGVNNWNLISEELKARAISLNVSPLYFSEAACKQKYAILRGRYACSSSSSMSRKGDLENDMYWFEELRKLRVAHLKRELEQYDGSIGTLQVKIKRLKAEKARDTSVSKQLRKSLPSSQVINYVYGGLTCETGLQTLDDGSSEVERKQLHSNPVVRESERVSQKRTSQTASSLHHQLSGEDERRPNATQDLPDSSPACVDVAASTRVTNTSPLNSIEQGSIDEEDDRMFDAVHSPSETEHGEIPAVSGTAAANVLQEVIADKVKTSTECDLPEFVNRPCGDQSMDLSTDVSITCEVADVELHGQDIDVINASNLVEQVGYQEKPVEIVVVDGGVDTFQADSGHSRLDEVLVTNDDSVLRTETNKNNSLECDEGVTHVRRDSVDLFTDLSSQQAEPSGKIENSGDRQGMPVEGGDHDFQLNKEQDSDVLEGDQTLIAEKDHTPILGIGVDKPVSFAYAKRRARLERSDNVTPPAVQSVDEAIDSTLIVATVPEGLNKGGASTTLVELVPCQQKHLYPEVCDSVEVSSTPHAVKKSETLGAENRDLGQSSDSKLMYSVTSPKESEKLDVSSVVPIVSTVKSESSKGGAITIFVKQNSKGSTRENSGLLSVAEEGKESPIVEGQIVIALDGPDETVSSPKSASGIPRSAGVEETCPTIVQIRSDVVDVLEASGVEEQHNTSARHSSDIGSRELMEGEGAHESPANATGSLERNHEIGQENASESTLLGIEMVHTSDVATSTSVLSETPKGKPAGSQAPGLKLDIDTEMTEGTATGNDMQLSNSESHLKRVLVQSSLESAASDDIEASKDVASVADQDILMNTSAEMHVQSSERRDVTGNTDLQIPSGLMLEQAQSVSHVAEVVGHQSSDSSMEVDKCPMPSISEPENLAIAKPDLELTVNIGQDATDPYDPSLESTPKVPKIIVDMGLEYTKEELSGVDSDAEPNSPVESLAGGLDTKVPSSREGSGSVQDQDKDGGGGRKRERTRGIRECVDSDVEKSEAASPVNGDDQMSPSSRRSRKEPRVSEKLLPLLDVLRKFFNHKSAVHFKGRQEDSRYSSLIRRHLDLTIVRARLKEGAYSVSSEFFRDLLLIFNNAMVFYPRTSIEFQAAKVLLAEATKEMHRIFQAEALMKQDTTAIRTREVKKRVAPAKVVAPSNDGGSAAKFASSSSPLTSLPGSGSRKRTSSRLRLVETPTNSQSEGGAARSGSVHVAGGRSSSRADDAETFQENDQEVNGGLEDRQKSQKGSGSNSRGKAPREELLEGILLKTAANKGLGRPKLSEVKEEEPTPNRPTVPLKGTAEGKLKANSETARIREPEKDKVRGKQVRGTQKDETKPVPKSRAATTARGVLNSHDISSLAVGRPSRGGRKPGNLAKEPLRPSEQDAKKRIRN